MSQAFRSHVSVLYVDEPVVFDQAQLRALFRLLGVDMAQEALCEAMEELARHLSEAEEAFLRADHAALVGHAARVEAVAGRIGMDSLRLAADGVIAAEGPAAMAATFFRMVRVGDRSLVDYGLICEPPA